MDRSLPQRAAEDRQLWKTFRYHSRTFSLSTRLLPSPVRLPVATVYLFCRTVDNLADQRVLEVGPQQALRELDAVRRHLEATLAGRPPRTEMLWRRLAEVHEAFGLPAAPFHELIEGATWDLEGRAVADRADLIHYSGLVGGSVGAMVLPFLVAAPGDAPALEPAARALGVAMQITNITRDVGEDLRTLERVYLPRTWMDRYNLRPADLLRPHPPAGYALLLEEMMETAEGFYERSFAGIDGLPPAVRRGIRAAARLYREIMNEVRARAYDNLTHRAYVPLPRKLRLLLHDGYAPRKARLLDRHRPVAPQVAPSLRS